MHQYIILESTFISTKEHIGTIEATPNGDKCFCSYDATFQSGELDAIQVAAINGAFDSIVAPCDPRATERTLLRK